MNRVQSLVPLVFALLSLPVLAQEGGGPIRVVRQDYDVTIAADGSSTAVVEAAFSPQTPGGVQAVGRQTISYQEGRSEVEILEAYTLKPGGTRVAVPPDRILTQVPPAAAQAPAFSDGKVKVLVFPDVAVGDQVVYKFRRVDREPGFPGQYSNVWQFPSAALFDQASVTLRYPRALKLTVDVRGAHESPARQEAGLQVRKWTYSNATSIPVETGAVDGLDRDARLVVSTFKDWAALAQAYDTRAAAMTVVTDEIRSKAREIVGERTVPRAKAEAIYTWVAQNIRYVAVYLGAGGYVPHAAEEVLRNRYGDCKDYTALLGALLAAEGIDSSPAIVFSGPRFSLPEAVTPQWFNHVILWVPQLSTWLDATARVLPFGSLGEGTADKPAIVTHGFKAIAHTPMPQPGDSVVRSDLTLRVGVDGKAQGETTISAHGGPGAVIRNTLQNAPSTLDTRLVAAGLGREGLTGSGTLTRRLPDSLAEDAGITATFTTGDWLNIVGAGAFRIPSGLLAPITASGLAMNTLNTPPAKVPRVCFPIRLEEKVTIELPAVLVPRLPEPATFSNRVARYEARYSLTGSTLTVSRTLATLFTRAVCTPEDSQAFREAAEVVRRDVQAQVLY